MAELDGVKNNRILQKRLLAGQSVTYITNVTGHSKKYVLEIKNDLVSRGKVIPNLPRFLGPRLPKKISLPQKKYPSTTEVLNKGKRYAEYVKEAERKAPDTHKSTYSLKNFEYHETHIL